MSAETKAIDEALPASLAPLALGKLEPGKGRAYAPIVWLALASHLHRESEDHRVWPSNARIASMTGLALRCVELGMAHLRAHGRILVTRGWRGLRYRRGRIIEMVFPGLAPRVTFPPPAQVREIWTRLRRARSRPVAAFALALAAEVHARAEGSGHRIECTASMAALARLVGAARGASFNARLAVLEAVGLLGRLGETWRAGFAVASLALAVLKIAARAPARLLEPPLQSVRGLPSRPVLAAMSEAMAREHGWEQCAW